MKKDLLLALLLFSFTTYGQNWQWALSCGKSMSDDFGILAADNNSNIYLASNFSIPYGIYGDDTLYTAAGYVAFSKIDASGNFLWTKQLGGNSSGYENTKAITFSSASDCIYLSGVFQGSITIGNTVLTSMSLSEDIFLAKYDSNGNCIWAKKAGGIASDAAYRISTDNNDNLYVVAEVHDSAYFDSVLVPKGTIIAKYDGNGNCLWAKRILNNTTDNLSTDQAYVRSISCYSNEILIGAITVNDTITVDQDTLFGAQTWGDDLLLAKFDSNGNLLWAKLDGGGYLNYNIGAKYDGAGNIYACGALWSYGAQFGNIQIPTPSNGVRECFLVKYDGNGNVIWVRKNWSSGFYGGCNPHDFSVSKINGSVYIAGTFRDTIQFDSYSVHTSNWQDIDMFVAGCDSSGNYHGVLNAKIAVSSGPTVQPHVSSVVHDINNSCYVSGPFRNTTAFGNYSLTSLYQYDVFIAKCDAMVGINEKSSSNNSILIYPNPNNGSFHIKLPSEIINFKNATAIIYSGDGREEGSVRLNNNNQLDIKNLSSGIYFLKLVIDDKVYFEKLIIQ
ncbi:MAG: T9SS type A sorting domain-containing protein [Bacteroidota bacterium]